MSLPVVVQHPLQLQLLCDPKIMKYLILLLLSASSVFAAPLVTDLKLVNAETYTAQPANGGSLPEGVKMRIRAVVNLGTLSVIFFFSDGLRETQAVVDNKASSTVSLPVAGNYSVTATPWTMASATGTSGPPVRADYTITAASQV